MPSQNKQKFDKDKDFKTKGKSKGKDFKSKYDRKSNYKKADDHDIKLRRDNDSAWYCKYPELAKNVGSIAFNRRAGTLLHHDVGSYNGAINIDPVMQVNYIPTPGASADKNSAINVMSNAAWKMLNRRFRGVTKYQASDFGIIQYGVLDAFANLAQAERVYGVLNYYSLNNTVVPRGVLIGLGVDPDGFIELADFRYQLNRLILSAKTLCLVKGYSLLDHYLFLANHIFKDKDSPRAQYICFVREGYWKYDPTTPNGSALKFMKRSTSVALGYTTSSGVTLPKYCLQSMNDILEDLKDQFSALLNDDDVDNVCSDILAFYGNKEDSAEIVHLAEIPEDYKVEPIYSDTMLRQLHNLTYYGAENPKIPGPHSNMENYTSDTPSTFTPSTAPSTTLMVFQQDNEINFNIHLVGPSNLQVLIQDNGWNKTFASSQFLYGLRTPMIDTDILCPTPEDVLEMTRWTVTAKAESTVSSGNTYYRATFDEYGTIICTNIRFFKFTTQQTLPVNTSVSIANVNKVYNDTYINMRDGTSTASDIQTLAMLIELSRFDWAPMVYGGFQGNFMVDGDTDNIIPLSIRDIHALHDVACLSQFKNPIMDFLVSEN